MKKSNLLLPIIGLLLLVVTSAIQPNRNITISPNASHLVYSKDSKFLFVATESTLSIHSGVNGTKFFDVNLDGKTGITALSISPSDSFLGVGFIDGSITIFSPSGQMENMVQVATAASTITSMCFSSDDKFLIYGTENDIFSVYNRETKMSETSDFSNERIFSIACSPTDQTLFVVGGGQLTLSRFALYRYEVDNETGITINEVNVFPDESNATVRGSVFSNDGSKIYRSGEDGKIYVYDSSTFAQVVEPYQVSTGTLYGVQVSKDGNFIASVNDTFAILIDVKANIVGFTVDTFATTAKTTALNSAGGNLIVITSQSGAQIYGQCNEGQFYDPATGCQPCSASCSLCLDSATQCFECKSAHFLEDVSCLQCNEGCLQCSSLDACANCDDTAHYIPDVDTNNCKCNITYFNTGAKSCESCEDGCQTCNDATTCIQCRENDGFQKKGDICDCKNKTYRNADICSDCIIGCSECKDGVICDVCDTAGHFIPTNASTCQCDEEKRFILNPTDNTCNCEEGYFQQQNLCEVCPVGCVTCQSAVQCLTCSSAELEIRDGLCKCIDRTKYIDQAAVCDACSVQMLGCLSCDFKDICLECDNSIFRVLRDGKCVCQSGYYEDTQNLCQQCQVNHCLQCSAADECTQCDEINNWVVENSTSCACKQRFVQFEDKCLSCPEGCLKCDENTRCSECDIATNYNPTPNVDGSCDCLQRFFHDQDNQDCEACLVGCFNCTQVAICISCDTSAHFSQDYNTTECVCQDSYYLESPSCLSCSSALKHCTSCKDSSTCTKCQNQLKIFNGKCGCDAKKFVNATVECQDCPEGCSACTSLEKCTSCQDGFSEDNDLCKKDGLDTLIIILIVIGVVAVIGAVFAIIKCIKKKKAPTDYQEL